MKKTLLFLSAVIFISCSKDFISDQIEIEPTMPGIELQDQVAVIGEKVPNPYSLDIMRKAYSNLSETTKGNTSINDIQATHHYVQFEPSSEEELESLYQLKDVYFYLYPIDHEVSEGWITTDPRYSINGFQHRWAYVPVNTDLTVINCPFEILYDIFSPDAGNTTTKSNVVLSETLAESLEQEAYKLCGIEEEPVAYTKAGGIRPNGKILYYDSFKKEKRGCQGLSVWAVRGTHSAYGHCDSDGNFTCNDTFKYKRNYHIHYSRTDFLMRENDSKNEIIYNYKGYKGPLYMEYGSESKAAFYAAILRAAIKYYYGDIEGLHRPPMEGDKGSAKLAIQAYTDNVDNGGNSGTFHNNDRFIFSPRPIVTIYRYKESGSLRNHADIYAATIHELTHASHCRINIDKYYETDDIVTESLAVGIQWYLTRKEYYSEENYILNYSRMYYTGIIEDLIDEYKTRSSKYYGENFDEATIKYQDNVTGYTPLEIEEAAFKSKNWEEWKNNIINLYPDKKDKDNVYEAFDYWNTGM